MATKLATVADELAEMDSTNTLPSALVKALAEIGSAAKDKVNPHFKSKYADIGSVIEAVRPVLARYRLGFTQHSHPSESGVLVETVLHHASGETLSMGTLYVPANKHDAQGFGSALTYARRYGLMTAFGVPAEDDDGNAASKASAMGRTEAAPITQSQFEELETMREKTGVSAERFCKRFEIDAIALLPAAKFGEAKDALTARVKENA
jgi:hypothetical protein